MYNSLLTIITMYIILAYRKLFMETDFANISFVFFKDIVKKLGVPMLL